MEDNRIEKEEIIVDNPQPQATMNEEQDSTQNQEEPKKKGKLDEKTMAIITLSMAIVGLFIFGFILGFTSISMAAVLMKSEKKSVKTIAIITMIIGIVDIIGAMVVKIMR